jgi:hypothetical protein
MSRALWTVASLAAASGILTPPSASAQAPGHEHGHATAPVDCTAFGAPPWVGLPEADRQRMVALERSVAGLRTPEAARAAGFVPALGNIPGMGVHYVDLARVMSPINIEAPHHLMFAPVDGENRLVGAAYAFMDRVDTDMPLPFDSELAHWHDHPEVAPAGQTLHMLHVWFVPSSSGPFSGLNFWLPYMAYGVEPPSSCWMAEEADAERIQRVAFGLAVAQADGPASSGQIGVSPRDLARGDADLPAILSALARMSEATDVAPPALDDLEPLRADAVRAMGAAAEADDLVTWRGAADAFLAGLTRVENAAVDRLLRTLTNAQMSTAERDAVAGSSAPTAAVPPEVIEGNFTRADADGDGRLSPVEYPTTPRARLFGADSFARFDLDGDGFLSFSEFVSGGR